MRTVLVRCMFRNIYVSRISCFLLMWISLSLISWWLFLTFLWIFILLLFNTKLVFLLDKCWIVVIDHLWLHLLSLWETWSINGNLSWRLTVSEIKRFIIKVQFNISFCCSLNRSFLLCLFNCFHIHFITWCFDTTRQYIGFFQYCWISACKWWEIVLLSIWGSFLIHWFSGDISWTLHKLFITCITFKQNTLSVSKTTIQISISIEYSVILIV